MPMWFLPVALAFQVIPANAYSVLTHEAIIDAAWQDSIAPLLVERFHPSDEQLKRAHAFAYGGCIIHDMGYYPFGSRFFSDLVHYVRTGDFVITLVRSAQDVEEYAFALGVLAHYFADTEGHPLAVNRSVPLLYPDLRRRFGDVILYEQDAGAHVKTEFGFDVLQVAAGRYAPDAYHDFIGFEVSKPVLERAFREVYGLELSSIFTSLDLALGSYRWAVSSLIPAATKAAWEMKKDQIMKAQPGITRSRFLYNISRASFEREWGRQYRRPGVGARILSWIFRLVPRVGPFKALGFRPLTPEAERLFMLSFNRTLEEYRQMLRNVPRGEVSLLELDLDTGQHTHRGEYAAADRAYAGWVERLQAGDFRETTAAMRAHILRFYSGPGEPAAPRRKTKQWRRLMAALEKLKALPTS